MAEEKRTRGVVNLARVVQKSRERYAPKDASKDLAKVKTVNLPSS